MADWPRLHSVGGDLSGEEKDVFSKIVLALDGTEQSQPAIDAVRDMAATAKVVAVHVVVHALEPEQQRIAEAQVEELRGTGITAHLELGSSLMGEEAEAIAKVADEFGADVIVIACRGRSPIAGAVLGSTTQDLLHLAPCPVLAVPTGSRVDATRV
jgi:nucleotide-binding universal stress UspA family protein